MVSLVKGLDAKEIRRGGVRRDGAFPIPKEGGEVVGTCLGGALSNVEALDGGFVVKNSPCQFQIRVGDCATSVGATDQHLPKAVRKGGAPDDGNGGGGLSGNH
jgi:hypothetical protein